MSKSIQPPTVEMLLHYYYNYPELNSKLIKSLFGDISNSTIANKKKQARAVMREMGVLASCKDCVVTKAAYKAWHFDVDELVALHKKQKSLGI